MSDNPTTTTLYYNDSSNPDRLTKYGYQNITYNSSGFPITYGSKHLDWTNGKLSKYYDEEDPYGFDSSESTEFTYNGYGQRVKKSYSYYPGSDYSGDFTIGKEVIYDYDHSGRLIREVSTEYFTESASETRELVFLYDESSMVGFTYSKNGATATSYYYQRNLQGDVVGIYNTSGTKIAGYNYDAWGNHTITASTTANRIIAKANPIRYRGYYYDEDTKLYYLNSRYYSPEFRRFISPDDTAYLDYESVNGLNLYCYCGNDPVNFVDPSGHFAISTLLIGLAVTSFVSWGLSKVFGSQISGGISSTVNGAGAIYTGVKLLSFGPVGWIAGGALIIIGAGTIALGTNEIVDGITGTNYIQNWTGWDDTTYNSIYAGSNMVSALGSIAGNYGMKIASNKMLANIMAEPQKVQNLSIFKFETYARYSNQWNLLPSKNGKGMRALSRINNGNAIRYGYGINNEQHFWGNYYWIVCNNIGKHRFPFL